MGAPRWSRNALAATLVLAAVAPAGVGGCVRIDGGAVEMSWVLRTPEGRAIGDCGCSDPQVATVRLHLTLVNGAGTVPGGTPCEGRAQCQFACQRETGATPFDIPETKPDEMYLISVDTLGPDGTPLAGVRAPAPVLRSVVRGQPTDMGALLLVTECANACSGMNGQGVCERP
ncbi:MAG TPA: hypothetical protein VMU50_14620 [Polyangia bacterium]|nr:hypothetical protein [Polyangia bacterium]